MSKNQRNFPTFVCNFLVGLLKAYNQQNGDKNSRSAEVYGHNKRRPEAPGGVKRVAGAWTEVTLFSTTRSIKQLAKQRIS